MWHCSVRAAPDDRILSDDEWAQVACDIMDRTGLAPYGQEDYAVRWIAVRHAPDHIHLVAILARQDGTRPQTWNGYYREAPRITLRRAVSTAPAGAVSEQYFFARLDRAGVLVRQRFSSRHPGEVTGYAVALPHDTSRAGAAVWFGGGKLAADLTLPKLRRRWNATASAASDRFTRSRTKRDLGACRPHRRGFRGADPQPHPDRPGRGRRRRLGRRRSRLLYFAAALALKCGLMISNYAFDQWS